MTIQSTLILTALLGFIIQYLKWLGTQQEEDVRWTGPSVTAVGFILVFTLWGLIILFDAISRAWQ